MNYEVNTIKTLIVNKKEELKVDDKVLYTLYNSNKNYVGKIDEITDKTISIRNVEINGEYTGTTVTICLGGIKSIEKIY